VRSPETVAEALLDYYGVRVTTFLLRGHDAFDDLVGYSVSAFKYSSSSEEVPFKLSSTPTFK